MLKILLNRREPEAREFVRQLQQEEGEGGGGERVVRRLSMERSAAAGVARGGSGKFSDSIRRKMESRLARLKSDVDATVRQLQSR